MADVALERTLSAVRQHVLLQLVSYRKALLAQMASVCGVQSSVHVFGVILASNDPFGFVFVLVFLFTVDFCLGQQAE